MILDFFYKTLLLLRKGLNSIRKPAYSCAINVDVNNPDEASNLISQKISEGKPLMIARYGSTELATVGNYLGVKSTNKIGDFITGKIPQWWWSSSLLNQMNKWSGFFPPTKEKISHFCELMLNDSAQIDILGCWTGGEELMKPYHRDAKYVHLRSLEPFWSSNPWSAALEDKKVLVIHPFADDILNQYNEHRTELFEDQRILPKFKSLTVIPAVQTLGSSDPRFKDWFEALRWMEEEIKKVDFDVALIGCGAYGLPLAAYVKRLGKQGIHLGGALQLLFGIKGRRWEDPNYGVKEWGIPKGSYSSMINRFWISPNDKYKPNAANAVEGACYW